MYKREYVSLTMKIVTFMPGSIVKEIGIHLGLWEDHKLVNVVKKDFISIAVVSVSNTQLSVNKLMKKEIVKIAAMDTMYKQESV